jgi:hypothetical protein
LARGEPILDEHGLAAQVEAAVERAERADSRFLARAEARLRAEAQGRRLTGCRLVRGTHGGTYVLDPEGTDEPPEWWNPSAARRAAGARPRAGSAEAATMRAADADAAREAVVTILARLRERSQPPEVRGVTPPAPSGRPAGGRRLALG